MGDLIRIKGLDPKKQKKKQPKTNKQKKGPEAALIKLASRETLRKIVKSAKQKARTHEKANDWNARILIRRAKLAEKRLRRLEEIAALEMKKLHEKENK
jgi:acyl-CoA reductase-like NAD-dependent aldehyde dehydrogenase